MTGALKALRKALTDTRSPFYKAIAGMEGARNPGDLRDKLYQHVRSMNSLELLRFSRTLSAGVSGVVGLFGFTMATIQSYLGGGAGTVAGLAIAGLVVIAVALYLSRRTARGQMGG